MQRKFFGTTLYYPSKWLVSYLIWVRRGISCTKVSNKTGLYSPKETQTTASLRQRTFIFIGAAGGQTQTRKAVKQCNERSFYMPSAVIANGWYMKDALFRWWVSSSSRRLAILQFNAISAVTAGELTSRAEFW